MLMYMHIYPHMDIHTRMWQGQLTTAYDTSYTYTYTCTYMYNHEYIHMHARMWQGR